MSKNRPQFITRRDLIISPPWEFPRRILPEGSRVYILPATNLPGSNPGYWVEHPAIREGDYGVLVDREVDLYELAE